jgi:polyribonucleotide nucleotidyltransferase
MLSIQTDTKVQCIHEEELQIELARIKQLTLEVLNLKNEFGIKPHKAIRAETDQNHHNSKNQIQI